MAQSGYTAVKIYGSTTPSAVPLAANLSTDSAGVELAINAADEKLYFKNASGTVKLLAANLNTVPNGGTGVTSLTGIVKGNGTSAFSAATAGTDYLAPPSGTAILKANSGGALANATAGTDYAGVSNVQTFTASQRGTVTTDNDLSFDLNVTNNFKCTPTAGGTLTFTNITAGQTGNILLINGSNYAIAAAATTKIAAADLATISATGTYWLSYFSPDGTNVYVVTSASLA